MHRNILYYTTIQEYPPSAGRLPRPETPVQDVNLFVPKRSESPPAAGGAERTLLRVDDDGVVVGDAQVRDPRRKQIF